MIKHRFFPGKGITVYLWFLLGLMRVASVVNGVVRGCGRASLGSFAVSSRQVIGREVVSKQSQSEKRDIFNFLVAFLEFC